MLKIYNSLSKKKEDFVPKDPDHIKFYACGPTVYNKIHIGNARAFMSADLLAKVLKGMYNKVTYVCNITDIDDKIIDAAKKRIYPSKIFPLRTLINIKKIQHF